MKAELHHVTGHLEVVKNGLHESQNWLIPYLNNVDGWVKELFKENEELKNSTTKIFHPSNEEIRLQNIINEYRTLINILINDNSRVVG